jgi:glycosyltransferase involved in cell wall biosynthesis
VVDRASLLFACEVGRHFDATIMFGRGAGSGGSSEAQAGEVELPAGVELVALPDYSSLAKLLAVTRVAFATVIGMWRGLARTDTVWAWGPHPFAVIFVVMALVRRKRVALCVRQNTLEYHRRRLPSRRWLPVLAVVWYVEAVYRLLARWLPTTVVGDEVARRYGGPRRTVMPITISLIRAADVVQSPPERDWTGRISLLTVARLEPEKNPLLLIDALARLERDRPGRFSLLWLGRGRLESAVRGRAAELGVGELLELRGYVPFGPDLLAIYRNAHLFAHVSLTEGVPQVLVEAMAAGLPIVATDVGGVRTVLDGGDAGMLVPAADLDAFVGAVARLLDEPERRRRLVEHGLEVAHRLTIENEAERVAHAIDAGSGFDS